MRARALGAALIGALALVPAGEAGAITPPPGSTNWPMFGHDLRNTGRAAKETAITKATVADLRARWRVELPNPVTASPVVAGHTVYVGDWDGVFHAFDSRDGSTRWTFQTAPHTGQYPGISSTATVDDGVVYASAGPNVYALDGDTGRQLWRFTAGAGGSTHKIESLASPVVSEGVVYAGVDADEAEGVKNLGIYAIDADTGHQLWRLNEPECISVWATAALDEERDMLYVPTGDCGEWKEPDENGRVPGGRVSPNNHAVIAVRTSDGSVAWRFQPRSVDFNDWCFGQPATMVDVEIDGERRELVTAGGKDGILYALDRSTGALVWSTRVGAPAFARPVHFGGGPVGSLGGLIGMAAFDGERLFMSSASFVPSADSHFFAVDAATGDIAWEDRASVAGFGGTSTTNGIVFSGGLDNLLRAYEAETGRLLAVIPVGLVVASQPAITGGSIYVSGGIGGGEKGGGAGDPRGGSVTAFGLPAASE